MVGWRAVIPAAFPPFGRIRQHGDGLGAVGRHAPIECVSNGWKSHVFEPSADGSGACRGVAPRFHVANCRQMRGTVRSINFCQIERFWKAERGLARRTGAAT